MGMRGYLLTASLFSQWAAMKSFCTGKYCNLFFYLCPFLASKTCSRIVSNLWNRAVINLVSCFSTTVLASANRLITWECFMYVGNRLSYWAAVIFTLMHHKYSSGVYQYSDTSVVYTGNGIQAQTGQCTTKYLSVYEGLNGITWMDW